MPRPRPAQQTTRPPAPQSDLAAGVMSALLPLHTAITLDWLADATATAAERTLDSVATLLYLEDHEGRLVRKPPASDLRRRSLQRAIDAFGLRARLDPSEAPAVAAALEAHDPAVAPAPALLRGAVDEAKATAAAKALGINALALAPLETAAERIGALLLMFHQPPPPERVRAFAEHVACSALNLRQAQTAREQGVIDIGRSVFDARKLESELQKELLRAARYRRAVSIAIVEATNLRLLRERFGRFLTDRLLERLGGMLAEDARDIDVIGAYKQSGYTMILTEASAEGAAVAARRLLDTARRTDLGEDGVPGLELHLVAGWATFPNDGKTTEALFQAAERRMYDAASQVA